MLRLLKTAYFPLASRWGRFALLPLLGVMITHCASSPSDCISLEDKQRLLIAIETIQKMESNEEEIAAFLQEEGNLKTFLFLDDKDLSSLGGSRVIEALDHIVLSQQQRKFAESMLPYMDNTLLKAFFAFILVELDDSNVAREEIEGLLGTNEGAGALQSVLGAAYWSRLEHLGFTLPKWVSGPPLEVPTKEYAKGKLEDYVKDVEWIRIYDPTEEGLLSIAKKAPSLKKLSVTFFELDSASYGGNAKSFQAMSHLANLKELDLRIHTTEALDGWLDGVWMLPSLENLSISFMPMSSRTTNTIFEYIAKIPSLNKLSLYSMFTPVFLSEVGLSALSESRSLSELTLLAPFPMTSETFRSIGQIDQLVGVHISGDLNGIEANVFDYLPSNIAHLTCDTEHLTDDALGFLAQFRKLTSIKVSNSKEVTGASINSWTGLSRLRTLALNVTSIGDAGAEYVSRIKSLKNLNLAGTLITDIALQDISNLPLEHLDLTGTAVSDYGLLPLRNMSTLKSLKLSITNVSENGVEELSDYLPECKIVWSK